MKLKRIEKISEKEYIVELDEMKFQMLILREDDTYLYVMIRAFDKQMFRVEKSTDEIEVYNPELGKWETENEFNDHAIAYSKNYIKELADELGVDPDK